MTAEYKEFPHGGDWAAYRQIYGRDVLDFSANVSPYGLPDSVRKAVCESLTEAHRYPDPECRELRQAIAGQYGLNRADILCGNGAADLIYRLAYAVRPKRALAAAPDFCEYERALCGAGCELSYREWMKDGDCVSGRILSPAIPPGTDLIIFSNPNNPSGCLYEPESLRTLARQCEEKKILLVVDECFLDFTDNSSYCSLLHLVRKNKYLCVLRAFTKFYGMAGLRLGWCASSDGGLLDRMRQAGPPWPVSAPAQAAGIAALKDVEYADRLRRLSGRELQLMQKDLRGLGLRVVCGSANYILFYTDRTELGNLLLDRGIAVRDCSNYRGLGPGWFRVAVRLAEENRVLVEALRDILH